MFPVNAHKPRPSLVNALRFAGDTAKGKSLTDRLGLAAEIDKQEELRLESLTDQLLDACLKEKGGDLGGYRGETRNSLRDKMRRTLMIIAQQLMNPQKTEKTIADRLGESFNTDAKLVLTGNQKNQLVGTWTNQKHAGIGGPIGHLVETLGDHFGGMSWLQAAITGRVLEKGLKSGELGIPYFHRVEEESSADKVTLFCSKPILSIDEQRQMEG